jgi:nitronate monooxygenase
MIIERSINNAARVIRTDFTEKVLEMEEKGATLEELLPMIDGLRTKNCFEKGNANDGIIYCGQSVGLINEILSVKEIIDRTMKEARGSGGEGRFNSITRVWKW